MADLKKVSCPSCKQEYRLPDSMEDRKVVCRGCQFAFSVPGVGDADSQNVAQDTDRSFDGAMFDSLDVDDLLNSKNSGLSQRRPDPTSSPQDEENGDAVPQRQQSESDRADASSPQKSKDQKRNSAGEQNKSSVTRGEDLIDKTDATEKPSALPITVLERSKKKSRGKKKRKRKKKEKEKRDLANLEGGAEVDDTSSDSFDQRDKGGDAIDPEEQAVFDYARAVNGRKNTLAILVALAIAIGLGGWFSMQEIDLLKAPLTENEREILEGEGFRLKASQFPRKGQLAALGRDIPRVGVAPRIRLDGFGKIEQPLPEDGMKRKFDPNKAFGDQRKHRIPARKEPPVDLDTRVAAEVQARSFTLGKRKVLGPALAVSPRNVVFVPEGEGIASYDLVSKKQIDYKSVGRSAGKSDRVSVLATTPDGRFMAAGLRSGLVALFQLDTQGNFFQIGRMAQKHFSPIEQIAVSPDSQLIATLDAKGQVAAWNVSTRKNNWRREIEKSKEGPDESRCLDLAFSSDGQQLLAALTDSDIVLRSVDGNEVARKNRPLRRSAVLSPIDRITVCCTETEISGFAAESDVVLWKKSIRRTRTPALALDAGGTTGLFFDGGKSIINFDIQTGDLVGRLAPVDGTGSPTDSKPIVSVDGQYLLYGSRNYANGKLRINHVSRSNVDPSNLPQLPPALKLPPRNTPEMWVTEEGKRAPKLTRLSLAETGQKITSVTLNDDGLLFYSTDSGGLHVYDWVNGIMVTELLIDRNKSISALAICGPWLAAGQKSGGILLYKVQASGKLEPHGGVFGHDTAVVGVRAMPVKGDQEAKDRSSIASVSRNGDLRVWDIPTRGSLLSVETFKEPPKSLVVQDDRTILVASTTHLATVNPDTKKVTVEGSRRGGTRVALSPDGKKLAFVNGRAITIVKARTGVAGQPVPLEQNPGAIQFTRDSRFLQIDFSKRLAIVNYRTGKTVDTFDVKIRPHSGLDTLFAVSSGETLMAAISEDGQRIIIAPVGDK